MEFFHADRGLPWLGSQGLVSPNIQTREEVKSMRPQFVVPGCL